MEGELNNFLRLVAVTIASLLYCYYIASKIPKGFFRLLSILPAVALLFVIPFNIYSFHIGASTWFLLGVLCNLKLLLFAFDQAAGPLYSPKDLLHFLLLAIFPFKIKQTQSKSLSKILSGSVLEALNKATLLGIWFHCYKYKQWFHEHMLLAVLWFSYVYLSGHLFFVALGAIPGQLILGVEVEPQFKAPLLSTSLQNFWGHRWNLRTSDLLRATIYVPVRSICTRVIGSRWASLPAVFMTFAVSGLMHEMLFYHITRESPTWEVTWFFILHGVFVDMEIVLKKKLVATNKFRLHSAVSRLWGFTALFMTSGWLFAQIQRNGYDEKIVTEFNVLVNFLKGKTSVGN